MKSDLQNMYRADDVLLYLLFYVLTYLSELFIVRVVKPDWPHHIILYELLLHPL